MSRRTPIVCIHATDPGTCWRCADMRDEGVVLAVLTGAAAPLSLEEVALRAKDPNPWWHGPTCGALVRLLGKKRALLHGGRFSLLADADGAPVVALASEPAPRAGVSAKVAGGSA